jgi:hypothetical protein
VVIESLRVLITELIAYAGLFPPAALPMTVLTESGEAFGFDRTGMRWNECHIPGEELASARRSFCPSFGSCSFNEPIDDLPVLGWL